MWALIIMDVATRDIREIYDWYESKQTGRGDEFAGELTRLFERIEQRPESLRLKSGNIRYGKVQRFQQLVWFLLDEDQKEARVFAVLHEKRHPDTWLQRLESL